MRLNTILIISFFISGILLLDTANAAVAAFNSHDAALQKIIRLSLDEKWDEASSNANAYYDRAFAHSAIQAIKLYQSPKSFQATEIINFIKKNDWLPLQMYASRIESSIKADYPAEFVIEWFTFMEPKTQLGKFYFLNANIERKTISLNDQANRDMLRYYWRTTEFELSTEEFFLKKYRNYLTIEDCLQKIEFLTWKGRHQYAERLLSILPQKYVGMATLRLQVAKKPDALFKLINGKSSQERSDEYIQYLYVSRLLENDHEDEALRRINKMNNSAFADKWWKLKSKAIRNELREKHYLSAYNLASKHGLEPGAHFADAEWLSGWIALRFLRNFDQALIHFQALYDNTMLANSKSKAAYWLGRTYEAIADNGKANEWFSNASQYSGTFYGHIAIGRIHGASKVNYFADNLKAKHAPKFRSEKAWKLANLSLYLYKNGANKFAREIMRTIPELELGGDEIQDIAKFFLENNLYGLAVDFSKTMANHSGILIRAGYPSHVPIYNNNLPKGVYLGIIRQESNFNQNATSPAGASGLMQLMPGTAANMTKKLGLNRSSPADPTSNVLQGVAYVNQLNSQYQNLVLTLAAYNAGPGNVNKWLQRYGDPRELKSEYQTIDWIESIPFEETRNYVKKVMENFMIYDNLLSPHHSANTLIAYLENK